MTSSVSSHANPGAFLYHASTWGIEGFAEALAAEVAGLGIDVPLVKPGGARTDFAKAQELSARATVW
jgi:NAD(P)-dependent dehydrogenase (short-subunit alcohol dehydrogenase family)